jgi:uncharacterized protein YjbI with pentapeptide repeats
MAAGKYTQRPTRPNIPITRLRKNSQVLRIGTGLMLVLLGIVIGAFLFRDERGYQTNVYTEALAIIVTVVIIDALNRRRDLLNTERELREQLLMDAASTSNETAKNAVHQMMRREWLRGEDGMLIGQDLFASNLSGADLEGATLCKTDFRHASLVETRFVRADLTEARLSFADLARAELIEARLQYAEMNRAKIYDANLKLADLRNANLRGALLQGAELVQADLRGADCFGVNFENTDLSAALFEGANLASAKFNSNTIMPNGLRWTMTTDLTLFTNPLNPQFFRNDWTFSLDDLVTPANPTGVPGTP